MDTQEGTEQKKKRTTVADLKKRVKKLEEDIAKRLGPLSDNIDNHLDEIETAINNTVLEEMASLASRIEALEKGFLADAPATWGEIDSRLIREDRAIGAAADMMRDIAAGIADWGTRMEDAEDSIGAFRLAIARIDESATHTEPVPLPRPIPEADRRVDLAALKAIAQVAQNMGDVLHMTRALKASSELTDQERREIISIACIAADVPYAENLLARAGVRSFEA